MAVADILGAPYVRVVGIPGFKCRGALNAALDNDTVLEVMNIAGSILLAVPTSATAGEHGGLTGRRWLTGTCRGGRLGGFTPGHGHGACRKTTLRATAKISR